ncbi:MAG: 30S ribosomal protein THX [Flavobacteriaceae bacterium]|jgi:ribosomal small subunit protein bTHX|nr:30S ribosomal protein THX [Flavobacteriaceae bacterium]MDG2290839.1 30S ribosomal protein THX [Flavobacteriaceae bacterium]
MGKGDKKTRRGKIVNKSYGVRRPKTKKLRKLSAQKQAQ